MTNSINNTPSNQNDSERGYVKNARPVPPRTSAPHRTLLHEDIEYDVWLEEGMAYAATQEAQGCDEAS